MKKFWRWLIPLFVLTILTAGVAVAGTDRSPSKDTTCEASAGGTCFDQFGVYMDSGGTGGNCIPSAVGFVGWDLSAITATIDSAELTMTTYTVAGATALPVEIQLYVPSNHTWTENGTSPGSSGTTLAATSVVLTNGATPQEVVFGGAGDPADADALGAHLNSLKATGSATVGVRISANCEPDGSTVIVFNDMENSGSLPGGAAATEPDLILADPTAISLLSVDAIQPGGYTAALFAVVLLLVVTLVAVRLYRTSFSRR